MGIFRTAIAVTGWGSLGGAIGYTVWTRKSKVSPIDPTDYIFGNTLIARFNPNDNPVTHDICRRKVPIDQIKPELLQPGNESKLVERFCAGVWSGWGYAYQRRFLEKKYRATETANQLWTTQELESSTYPIGTQITDHFEVVARSENSIIVRCGDSPRIQDVRASDGLFEMTTEIDREHEFVEFGLKSVFYNGVAKPDKEGKKGDAPMSPWIQWLHAQYDKVLMETAIRKCMR